MINCPIIKKINVPVCVISLSSFFEKRNWYCPQVNLQKCFYENSHYFDEKQLNNDQIYLLKLF